MAKEKPKNEIKTEEEKKPRRKIENEIIEIIDIVVRTDENGEQIKQIRFKVDEETTLTYKPTKEVKETEKIKGLKTIKESREKITMNELDEKIYFWNNILNETGKLRLLATFREWDTQDNDGNPVTYKYFMENDFNVTYPVDENNKEIKKI